MAKAIIVIGYHRNELNWGRKVRDYYLSRNFGCPRDVQFYEIEHSKVNQGRRCLDSERKIKKSIRKCGDIKLIIDLHCGFLKPKYKGIWPRKLRNMEPNKRYLLFYQSNNPDLINQVSMYDKNIMIKSPLQTHKNIYGISLAIFDFFFSGKSYNEKGRIFNKSIQKAVEFINSMYDIHFQGCPAIFN